MLLDCMHHVIKLKIQFIRLKKNKHKNKVLTWIYLTGVCEVYLDTTRTFESSQLVVLLSSDIYFLNRKHLQTND